MSSTAVLSSRHHALRHSPVASFERQVRNRQTPHPPTLPNRTSQTQQGSLDTSPSSMSSAAYYGQRPVGYDTGNGRDSYSHQAAPVQRPWPSAGEGQSWPEEYQSSYSQTQTLPPQRQQQTPQRAQVASQVHLPVISSTSRISRPSTRPSTPNSTHSSQTSGTMTSGDETLVKHSLQIPARISSKGGNLADFTAQLTCLLWHGTPAVLEYAEKSSSKTANRSIPAISPHLVATEGFKKRVGQLLSTTQVTQNVILLALLFVYRLNILEPSMHGLPGSEHRLLTVALMLGNKFLDDNTYTNKTWAEVSGISVKDIHNMEVEFLSGMRYTLLTSSDQWEEWLDKLSVYFAFCERLGNAPSPSAARTAYSPTLMIPSPTAGRGLEPIPVPATYQQVPTPSRLQNAPAGLQYPTSPFPRNPGVLCPEVNATVASIEYRPDLGSNQSRKRSWDEQIDERPAKRSQLDPQAQAPRLAPDIRRLPAPSLTLNTGGQAPLSHQPQYAAPNSYAVSLPPLDSGSRAMSTVYSTPSTTGTWAPAHTVTSGGPIQQQHHVQPVHMTQTSQYPSTANYGTPTKRLSPISSLTPAGQGQYNGSPLHDYSGFHTPISHSPSIYLHQRHSPYKPIRNVRTLLNPPNFQGYQLPAITPSQMHYQPIGRRNDERTGIVPEYRQDGYYGANSRHSGLPQPPSGPVQQQRYPANMN